jgi:hypothetical protein
MAQRSNNASCRSLESQTEEEPYLQIHDGAAEKSDAQEDGTGHLEHFDLAVLINIANQTQSEDHTRD